MKVELFGGPMDGQEMTVPDHLLHVRMPVPGSAAFKTPTFEDPTQAFASSIWVATYERWAWVQNKTLFKYQGQERVST